MNYNTVQDAHTSLINSGVVEWFLFDDLQSVSYWMYVNSKTPEQAYQAYIDWHNSENNN